MRILAVDVGTANVGWASGSAGDRTPSLGTYNPPATQSNLAWLGADFRAWLTVKLQAGVTHVVFCTPILVHSNNWWTIRKVVSLGYQIELTGYDHSVVVEEAAEPKVRKHFLSPHKVPVKSADIKAAVMARCRALGWSPANDHEGDSAALWDYAMALKTSRLAALV